MVVMRRKKKASRTERFWRAEIMCSHWRGTPSHTHKPQLGFPRKCKYHIIHSPHGFSGIIYNTGWGLCLRCSLQVRKEWVMMSRYMSVKVTQITTPGITCPTLYEQCLGSLTFHRFFIIIITCARACETVYRPYSRRLESQTVWRWRQHFLLSYLRSIILQLNLASDMTD